MLDWEGCSGAARLFTLSAIRVLISSKCHGGFDPAFSIDSALPGLPTEIGILQSAVQDSIAAAEDGFSRSQETRRPGETEPGAEVFLVGLGPALAGDGGVQRYESGQPMAFGCATAPAAYGQCIRFDQVPGSSILSSAFKSGHWNPVTDSVFNSIDLPNVINPSAAAFDDPNSGSHLSARGTYVFGTMPRVNGAVRMHPYLSEDFSFIKRTKLTETKALNLQVTMINALNRHIWNRPGNLNPYASQTGINNPIPSFGLMNVTNFSRTGGGSYLLLPRELQLELKFEY